jgi:hypothetical protein
MSDFKFSNETYFELDGSFKEGFTVVPNYILNNRNLSYKAVGLYVQILQYQNSPTHKIYVKSLMTYKTDKESSVRSGINELMSEGFLTREAIRNERGQMNGYRYIVHAQPIEKTTIEPKRENPVSVNPLTDNHVYKSKIGYKENNKKENREEEEEVRDVLSLYYDEYKLSKKKLPHIRRFLIEHKDLIEIDLWHEIFIRASEDNVGSKYLYVKAIIQDLVKDNIYTLNDYKKRKADQNKSTKKPNKSIPQKDNKNTSSDINFVNNFSKGASSGVNNNFTKYTPSELEKMLLESQKGKFN